MYLFYYRFVAATVRRKCSWAARDGPKVHGRSADGDTIWSWETVALKSAVTTGHDDSSSRTPEVLLHLHEIEKKEDREVERQERET
jgi:hypothetical protein